LAPDRVPPESVLSRWIPRRLAKKWRITGHPIPGSSPYFVVGCLTAWPIERLTDREFATGGGRL
jgi:hypothetical protein